MCFTISFELLCSNQYFGPLSFIYANFLPSFSLSYEIDGCFDSIP